MGFRSLGFKGLWGEGWRLGSLGSGHPTKPSPTDPKLPRTLAFCCAFLLAAGLSREGCSDSWFA